MEGICVEVVQKVEKELFEFYKDLNFVIKLLQLEKWGGVYYSDVVCNLISFIYNDKYDIQLVNMINNGVIVSILDDFVVEVNCVMMKIGFKLIVVGDLLVFVCGFVQ